jgi:muramoyltetrapeptide carboxypeptidase
MPPYSDKMLKPPRLKASSVIGVVAPASPVRREFLELGVAELSRLGFETRLGSNLYSRARYTAGSASERIEDLVKLWDDPEVDAIFCARGGYGSLDVLRGLDPMRFSNSPKIFLGSSDITALLCFLLRHSHLVCFHGPMVAQKIARGDGSYDAAHLVRVLGEEKALGHLSIPQVRMLHPGASEGILLGGCLSLITALVGTPHLPSFDGAIVFFEDTGVRPYQLDRMLTQLKMAGCLAGVRGMIFGEMPDCEQHPNQGYTVEELLADLTEDLGIPVGYNFPSGHTRSADHVLPLGIRARLDETGLTLLEGAVS